MKKNDFKKGIVSVCNAINTKGLIIATIIIALSISQDIAGAIYKGVQSQNIKDILQLYIDGMNIINIVIPYVALRIVLLIVSIAIWIIRGWDKHFRKADSRQGLTMQEKVVEVKETETIKVLGHSTKEVSQFKLKRDDSKVVNLEIQRVNLVEKMAEIERHKNYEEISSVILLQDEEISKFKKSMKDENICGYMGISHTPLILRAGYRLGDGSRFQLFHYVRNPGYYDKLNDSQNFCSLEVVKKEIRQGSKELLVTIATTFDIQDSQLVDFSAEDKSILKFRTRQLGFDIVNSDIQVNEYIQCILKEMRDITQLYRIKRVHMCISSSIPLTFALGQVLSKQYDPDIIIYNYEMNAHKVYPWGIRIFEESRDSVVVN